VAGPPVSQARTHVAMDNEHSRLCGVVVGPGNGEGSLHDEVGRVATGTQ